MLKLTLFYVIESFLKFLLYKNNSAQKFALQICYYEKVIDSSNQQREITRVRNTKYYLIINSVFLIFAILLAIVRLKKNDTATEIK